MPFMIALGDIIMMLYQIDSVTFSCVNSNEGLSNHWPT